jgi:uncharacterized membrane protein YebE (DUF533 family)
LNRPERTRSLSGNCEPWEADMAIDAKKLLDQFLNSGMATGVVAGMLGGALARRSGLGGIAKIGGLALVGTLAYQAWQRHQQQQQALPETQRGRGIKDTLGGVLSNLPGIGDLMNAQAPASSPFASTESPPTQQNQLGVALLTAMISAAKADGHVDQAESQRIVGQMDTAGLSSDEKSFLLAELAKPLNIDDVVKHATTPEIAAQLYTASAIVIDDVNEAERNYLATLAERMRLDPTFVAELQRQLKALG